MIKKEIIDERGRKYEYLFPDDNDGTISGVLEGPQDVVDVLKLPDEIATRLHNELYRRRIFTYNEAKKRSRELQAAIQAVLKLDTALLLNAFYNIENETFSLEEV